MFNATFPDDCRLCEHPLTGFDRFPVCPTCVSLSQPLDAEYFCRSCRTPFVEAYPLDEQGQCAHCRENLVSFDSAYSFGSFDGSLQALIHLFKYGKVETLAEPLGKLLLRALPRDEQFDTVIAMPMHWRKRWERGFNQAELLAVPVAKRYGLKLSPALGRTRRTKSQAGLTQKERQENLKGSFRVQKPSAVRGQRILLIDDVFTTGATLHAATAALKSEGAARVVVLTLARVDRRAKSITSGGQSHRRTAPELTGSRVA